MFIRLEKKEDREIVGGKAVINGMSVTPAKRKKKKGTGYEYGLEIKAVDGDYEETEDDE